MKQLDNKTLIELSNIFKNNNHTLYVVGGFVRDSLLGLNSDDIDVCSSAKNEELIGFLKGSGFTVKLASKKLGTVIISKKGFKFEHTTFRKESYKEGGFHTPNEVQFVKDLYVDTKRRDFTISSLYYNVLTSQLTDPFNGLKDLQKGLVRVVISPKHVFVSDGLRILRMIRIAGQLNYKIERKTFNTAKKMKQQLKDISKDRKWAEFNLILTAKEKYGFYNNAVKNLLKLNVLDYIFPNLRVLKPGVSYNNLIKGFGKSLNYYNLNNNLNAFMLDLCIFVGNKLNELPSEIAKKLLNTKTVGISVKLKNNMIKLIKAYEVMFDLKTNLQARHFIVDNFLIINDLLELLENSNNQEAYKLLGKNYSFMKNNNVPFSIKQLKINGDDILNNFDIVKKEDVGAMLKKANNFALRNKDNNNKKKLIKYLKEGEIWIYY